MSALALTAFGALPSVAGATGRHHHRHRGLFHLGFAKPVAPTVTISQLSPSPLLDNFGPLDVTVTRTGSTKKALNLTLNTTSGTADGSDYTPGPYTVSIPKGQTTTDVFIAITDDESADANEDFSVSLANAPKGTTIVGGSHTATIVNDDQSGSFTVPNGDTITLSNGSLAGCDVLQEALVDLSNHNALTTGTTGNGCPLSGPTPFSDSWSNTTGAPVTVGVLLTDTSCNSAMYESDDLINNDSGDGWVTGDHNAIWTLPSGTYLAITDAASCTYPTDREPGPDDQGNLLATVSVTPSG